MLTERHRKVSLFLHAIVSLGWLSEECSLYCDALRLFNIPINYILLIFHERPGAYCSLDLHYQNNKSEKYGRFCKAVSPKASVLEGHDLVFVHCVSSEPMLLVPMGYRVFSLNAVRFTSEESLLIVSKG
jgi:hypothetical protein